MDEQKAQKVLHDFYTDNVPEPINTRHLLHAGKAIVPYLIIEIQKKEMPKRRYVIYALGKIGDRRALDILIKLLDDKSETEDIRGDALTAIWHIDKKTGKELAQKYGDENEYMDRVIEL